MPKRHSYSNFLIRRPFISPEQFFRNVRNFISYKASREIHEKFANFFFLVAESKKDRNFDRFPGLSQVRR